MGVRFSRFGFHLVRFSEAETKGVQFSSLNKGVRFSVAVCLEPAFCYVCGSGLMSYKSKRLSGTGIALLLRDTRVSD